jgi:hypothetical protein
MEHVQQPYSRRPSHRPRSLAIDAARKLVRLVVTLYAASPLLGSNHSGPTVALSSPSSAMSFIAPAGYVPAQR